jgi:hypothetical protein
VIAQRRFSRKEALRPTGSLPWRRRLTPSMVRCAATCRGAASTIAGGQAQLPANLSLMNTYEESLCVALDAGQITQLEAEYGLQFDDPHVPTSAGSGPGTYTVAIHPAQPEDDCGDCRQRIDVLCEDEDVLAGALAEVEAFVQSIGGCVCH